MADNRARVANRGDCVFDFVGERDVARGVCVVSGAGGYGDRSDGAGGGVGRWEAVAVATVGGCGVACGGDIGSGGGGGAGDVVVRKFDRDSGGWGDDAGDGIISDEFDTDIFCAVIADSAFGGFGGLSAEGIFS